MYHIRKDKRSMESSGYLYDALASWMGEKQFEAITVTEVVTRAKLGRATFYRNFSSLDDILRWQCDEAFRGLYVYLLEYYRLNNSVADTFRVPFLKPFLRYWYIHSRIMELLIQANRLDIAHDSFMKMFELISQHVDRSHEVIWAHLDYFAAVRAGTAINILIQWIKNDKNIPPDELADLIVNQMIESLHLNLLL